MEVAQVNLPVGVLIWVMIIPMLVKIDFAAMTQVKSQWSGIGVTLFVSWFVKTSRGNAHGRHHSSQSRWQRIQNRFPYRA
jgi:hypothetical protein